MGRFLGLVSLVLTYASFFAVRLNSRSVPVIATSLCAADSATIFQHCGGLRTSSPAYKRFVGGRAASSSGFSGWSEVAPGVGVLRRCTRVVLEFQHSFFLKGNPELHVDWLATPWRRLASVAARSHNWLRMLNRPCWTGLRGHEPSAL